MGVKGAVWHLSRISGDCDTQSNHIKYYAALVDKITRTQANQQVA